MTTQEARRVVVAGGSGFIGRSLCRALISRGYQVTALTRGRARPASVSPDGPLPAFETWDAKTAANWAHLAEGAYAIVNLAGESIGSGRWNKERKLAILESRVQAGQAVAQALKEVERKPEVLIQASAAGYYGDAGDEPVDESSPPGTGYLTEVCLKWEESSRPVESMGVRRAVIRSGVVLGRGGGVLEQMMTPFRLFLGGPFGSGNQGFPWIHIEDEVGAILFLMERADAQGPFNLTAPEAVSNLEFCRELGKAMSRPCGFSVPEGLLRLVFGEMARELLLSGSRPFPRKLMEMGYVFRHPRLAGALKQLISNG